MRTSENRSARLQASDGPATGSTEGRRAPRLEVVGRIHGHILGLDVPANVTEIGIQGFRIETNIETPVGQIHEFRFTLGDGSVVFAPARVVHCHREVVVSGTPIYVAGCAFVEPTWRGRSPNDLVDEITSTLRFDLG